MKTAAIIILLYATWQIDARFLAAKERILNEDGLDAREEECITELHLNREETLILNKLRPTPEDNADYNKFVACSFKKMGLMNEDGEINYEELHKYILDVIKSERDTNPASLKIFELILSSSIDKCRQNPSTEFNHGLRAIKTMTCVTTHMREKVLTML